MEKAVSVEYYLKDGSKALEKPGEAFVHRVVAKKIVCEQPRYYLSEFNGGLLDPKKLTDREIKSGHSGFRQVGPEAFNAYIKYISTATATTGIKNIERMI